MTGRACGAHAGRLMAQKRRGRAGVAVGLGMLRRASTRAVQMGFFTRLDGIPEPPSGYIPPEGASRNTWANIYKNKGRIDYCVQQFGVSSAPACLRAAWSAWVSCGRLRVHFTWRARGHASRTRHRPSQRGVEHIQEMDGSGGTFLVVHRRESPWLDLAFRACVKRFFSAWACNAMWRVPTVHFQRLDTAVAYIHHTIRR